ncbi:MAG: hypothetical protein ACOC32_00890 [Nanoarchaeota archaeon]
MAEEIEFYDVKSKSKFKTTEYRVEERNGRFFAVTKSPSGDYECWRVLGKEKAEQLRNAA